MCPNDSLFQTTKKNSHHQFKLVFSLSMIYAKKHGVLQYPRCHQHTCRSVSVPEEATHGVVEHVMGDVGATPLPPANQILIYCAVTN